jgi:hypothetical protein
MALLHLYRTYYVLLVPVVLVPELGAQVLLVLLVVLYYYRYSTSTSTTSTTATAS